MYKSFKESLWPNRYVLTAVGIWPMSEDAGGGVKYFAIFRIFLSFVSMASLILPQLNHIRYHWGDVKILADTGCTMLAITLMTYKLGYMVARHRSFCTLYRHLQQFWNVSEDEVERKSYEEFAATARLIAIVLFASAICNFTTFMAAALIPLALGPYNDSVPYHRALPLDVSYGFDTQTTPNFETALACQSIALVFSVLIAHACDCTMPSLVFHVSGQFRFVGARFRAIGRQIENSPLSSTDQFELEIGRCLAHHQLIVEVAESLSALLSPMAFGQLLMAGIEICLSGYAVTDGGSTGPELVKFCAFLASMMAQLFVWCWPGEVLIRESTAVADAVCYDVPWFRLTPKLQRDLSFVIMRAQRECRVAVAFETMSLEKCTEVFKAAGSYMALLRSLQDQ